MNENDNLKDDSSIQILFGLLPLIIDASWSLRFGVIIQCLPEPGTSVS